MKITETLQVEHDLLRKMMKAMGDWLADTVPAEKLRERALLLEVALEDHAVREEQQLFVPLRAYSTRARELVNLMEVVHEEIRDLFREVADPALDPTQRLWTILLLTDEHFNKEEVAVFPLADEFMGKSTSEDSP